MQGHEGEGRELTLSNPGPIRALQPDGTLFPVRATADEQLLRVPRIRAVPGSRFWVYP